MRRWITRISLFITLVLGLGAAGTMYFRITKSNGTNPIFDKLSWGIFIGIILFSLGIFVLGILSWTNKGKFQLLDRFLSDKRYYWGMLILLVLVFLESIQDILFLSAGLNENYYPVLLTENRSLLMWAALISGQNIIAWFILGWQAGLLHLSSLDNIPRWSLYGTLIGLGVLILGGRGSLPANAPLPMLQILIVLLAVLAIKSGINNLQERFPDIHQILQNDLIPLVLLWIFAILLWSKVPLQPNYFISEPRPPSNMNVPISDAIYYEIQAQRLLAGEGFEDKVQHSFYNFAVSGFHLLGGEHYEDIYLLQIVFLAITPFLMYKLASLLHSRFTGWLLAVLFIIREYNALQLGEIITVSNVQVLMTEPIALLGITLFLYLSILWMKNREENWGMPFFIGAVIGLIALIRVELLSLAPVLGLIILLTYWKKWKGWVISGLFLFLGLSLALLPWVFRNYQKTGLITIDKGPVLERALLQYLEPNPTSLEGTEILPFDAFKENLGTVISKTSQILKSSTTSLQQTLVYLPSNHLLLGGMDTFVKIVPEKNQIIFFQDGIFSDVYLTQYIKSLPYWNARWDGEISQRSYLPQLLVIGLISQGIFYSWKKHSWIGLLPLLLMVTHALVYALIAGSGGRLIQVVDWITLLYLCFGLCDGIAWLVRKLTGAELLENGSSTKTEEAILRKEDEIDSRWQGLNWGIVVILVVLAMPITEYLIPRRFTDEYLDNRIQQLSLEEQTTILTDLNNGQELLIGKALYPSFFQAEEYYLDDRQGRTPEPGQAQMIFYLVGTRNLWISIPVDAPVDPFPHGSEVILLGETLRDSEEDLARKMWPYFEAEDIIFLLE